MKSPAFQFYAADWLSDMPTRLLTFAERGLYIDLLSYCWREGYIPADSSAIAQLSGCHDTVMVEKVMKLFTQDPSNPAKLLSRRLDLERIKQENNRKVRKESGLRGSMLRWNKPENNSSAIDLPMAKNGSSSSSSSSSSLVERERCDFSEIPPMQKKEFDAMAGLRGIPKECSEWFWNTNDARNWVDATGQTIRKVEPLLLNAFKNWRSKERKSPEQNQLQEKIKVKLL